MAYTYTQIGMHTYSQINIIKTANKPLFEKVNKHIKKEKMAKKERTKHKPPQKIPGKQCIKDVPQL